MKINALSVDESLCETCFGRTNPSTPFRLDQARIYCSRFSLALTDRPLLDERFDRVEAWKYGPVIPSGLPFFKKYGGQPIEEPTTTLDWSNPDDVKEKTPTLDEEAGDDEKEKREKAQARAIVESICAVI